MKLSVIVPVYNVETTLRRCVQSIIDQRVPDIEVILIDDGSRDESGLIAKDIARRHDNVQLIQQSNQGLSAARNAGLEICTGDYITFVDSDDWLSKDTYRPLLKMLSECPSCDILEFSVVRDIGLKGTREILLKDKSYLAPRAYWLHSRGYEHTYACNKIFKRSQFFSTDHENVRFPEGRVFEDIALMSQLLRYSPVVMTTSHKGYMYEWNPRGITATANGEQLHMLLAGQLEAATTLQLSFMNAAPKAPKDSKGKRRDTRPWVSGEEAGCYLAILNNQISVHRYFHDAPTMPSCRVRFRDARGPIMLLKILILNIFGLRTLCRVFSFRWFQFHRQAKGKMTTESSALE